MHALIDADILCYEMGSLKNPEEGLPLPWPLVQDRIDQRIEQIIDETEASSWEGFLTGKGNFRDEIATIRPYKGTRNRSERPFWYQAVHSYLSTELRCKVVDGYEADDAIATRAKQLEYSEGIICSKDKDLDQVPGWHYSWSAYGQKGKGLYYITEIEGLRNLYKQLLTGDATDNILGLYNVGPKSSIVKKIDQCEGWYEMWKIAKEEYEARFGSYAMQFLTENLELLRLVDDVEL
jgi:hypothetical protein